MQVENLGRRKKIDKAVIFIVLIILVLFVTAMFVYTSLKKDKITSAVENGETLKTLLLITDNNTLVYTELFIYNSKTHKGALFDIPGDVGSIISQTDKMDRIDTLFDRKKPEAYIDKVEEILDTDVPYYVITDLSGVKGIIDLFEGIKLFIPNPVELVDKENMLLLPSGNIVLDGEKAALFMSYREQGEDNIESISRRQKVIQALLGKIGESNRFLKNRKLDSVLNSFVQSNLSKTSVIALLNEMKNLDSDRMVFQRVLGSRRKTGEKTLLFPHYEGKLLKETLVQTVDSLANDEEISADVLQMSIDILNGTDQNGLAKRTSEVFKSFGFEILKLGNYTDDSLEKTMVISRSLDTTVAEKAAEIIKCKNVKFSTNVDLSSENISGDSADVIVILGKDFDGRYCKD